MCPAGSFGGERSRRLRRYRPALRTIALEWKQHHTASNDPDTLSVEFIANEGAELNTDSRLDALITMAILAEQHCNERAGLSRAITSRPVVEGLPLSQLVDRLTAIAIAEEPSLGINNR